MRWCWCIKNLKFMSERQFCWVPKETVGQKSKKKITPIFSPKIKCQNFFVWNLKAWVSACVWMLVFSDRTCLGMRARGRTLRIVKEKHKCLLFCLSAIPRQGERLMCMKVGERERRECKQLLCQRPSILNVYLWKDRQNVVMCYWTVHANTCCYH